MNKLFALAFFIAFSLEAQTPAPVPAPTPAQLPSYLAAGAAFNQFAGLNFWASAIVPVSSILPSIQSTTMYESTTVDLFPVKATINGKPGYLITTSVREGFHRVVVDTPKFTGLAGADVGYAFTQGASVLPGAAVLNLPTSGISAAVTITGVWHISKNWSVMLPVRALYLSSAGGWNPIAEIGICWKSGGKP